MKAIDSFFESNLKKAQQFLENLVLFLAYLFSIAPNFKS